MKHKDTNNYYLTIKPKMMKEFSAMFKGANKSLIQHFDNENIIKSHAKCKSKLL